MTEEIASLPSSPPVEYSFEQIFDYFQYICDLVEDGYPLNIQTPEESFNE